MRVVDEAKASGNYLRVRGEYPTPADSPDPFTELPPRARRIQLHAKHSANTMGTTSACAENTAAPVACCRSQWNYLRVRGEYEGGVTGRDLVRELPPRARRIRLTGEIMCKLLGTTSACAENTFLPALHARTLRNYLRVRGEYGGVGFGGGCDWELPPRARRILNHA